MMGLTPVYIWSEPNHSDLYRTEYLRRKRVNSKTSKTKTDDRQTNIGLSPLSAYLGKLCLQGSNFHCKSSYL